MKIYKLELKEEAFKDKTLKKAIFYLEEDNRNPMKVTIYSDKEVFLISSNSYRTNYIYDNNSEINLYELAFNQEFINLLINCDPDLILINDDEDIIFFKEFKAMIENIINQPLT